MSERGVMDTRFSLSELAGKVRIAERGKCVDRGAYESWESIELCSNEDCERVSFDIGLEEDGEIEMGISVHHVKNEEDDRVFHAGLYVKLSRDDLKALRRYIDLLLKISQ